jgi:Protein of unknown function (DUF4232)
MRLLWLISVAAALAAPPACRARDLEPHVDTNGASGTIIVYATLRNRSGRACTVRGRMVVSLRDAKTRRPLRIIGNPHSKLVRGRLRAGRNNIFWLQWENYCGPGKPMFFEATFGKRHDIQRSRYPGARCETRSAPSRLRLFRIRR